MPSKHVTAKLLIQRGLYDNLTSFAELEQRIGNLGDENTKIVGDALEVFVEGYLATHQKLQADAVWLVGQVPLAIRQELNLPKDAKGIDGVFRTRTGTLVPYQVKFRSNRAYLTYTEIAPFLGITERAADRIVFTNSNELAEDVKNRDAMRTVRGIDFDDLTKDDFQVICCWLKEQPAAISKPSPYPYQVEALAKINDTLAHSDRAHVVMACGTGKTLVALWTVEQLKPRTVLVLVPSLTLLQQTLDEWSRHNSWGSDFSYICVCSDPTVASKDVNDPITFHRTDAEFRIDTDPKEVRRFIQRDTASVKVIFSTYQSSPIVSEGVRGLSPLNIAIFDEAHKTTGPQGGLFAHSLSDKNVRIRKRLFFTATPRHYDIRHRDREGDFRIVSMDDENVYGSRAYTLTFGSAARQGIICNYKVIISVVDGHEVNDFALKHGITLVKDDLIGARWVANQIAVERAIEKTGGTRAITFHSRVSSAKEFSADTSRGIQQWLPDFAIFHVNGTQNSSERKHLLRSFREAAKALITNARCLTEGIDVPAVDMVAFIDPRHSRIDIAQATGRAMRKPIGSKKAIGYVVVPLFLERQKDETLEEALHRSEFGNVANILNAMQEQDEDLVEIIRELKEAKGRGEVFNPRRLADKIEVLGPSIELSTLRSNIFVEAVDSIGSSWDEWFGILLSFQTREGHCLVPRNHNERTFKLGQWVSDQRKMEDTMLLERRQRLDAIGFVWDPLETKWDEAISALTAFKVRQGHCFVPLRHIEGTFQLGTWVVRQRMRARRGILSVGRMEQLDAVGFVWDHSEDTWEESFAALNSFKAREGHCNVPQRHLEKALRLGLWVSTQRMRMDTLPVERRKRLDAIGFTWDVIDEGWEKGFAALKSFKAREGHCNVHQAHIESAFKLGQWVSERRKNRHSMSLERRQRLDAIGFVWQPRETTWEEGFAALMAFKTREGHCRVPISHAEGTFKLGRWVHNQRKNICDISADRRKRLDAIGFVWSPIASAWEEGFAALMAFKTREGHFRVPISHAEGTFKLGRWVRTQRDNISDISADRRKRLDAIGFVWTPFENAWEEGFAALTAFKIREGHCRVPYNHLEHAVKLGQWINTQRTNATNGTLSAERKDRLTKVGFIWKVHESGWDKGFAIITLFKAREGHCRVPSDHVENTFKLGTWVKNQRKLETSMSAERRKRLDEIGFVWKVR
jgi:superfamily II DNA or RNA helicase